MAKYTLELRELFEPIKFNPPLYTRSEVESWFKDYSLSDYLTTEQISVIENNNMWSKDKLAKKIVDHYYMRELGFETPALFKHYAKVTMNEIMERYLPLIYSVNINYDPLVNVDYTETFNRSADSTNSGTSNSNTSGLTVNSDTPQKQINKDEILSGKYASSTGANEVADETNTTSNGETNEEYTKRVKGNSGVSATAQKMVEQFRDNIVNVDSDIIKELSTLFMGLY